MSRMTEFKVGLTVIVAVVVLIGSVMWLKSMSLHEAKHIWRVRFPTTGGLASSDEVQVNGIRKGQVKAMRLDGDHVLVDVELDRSVPLTHDSKVAIRNVGLMGEKVIAVDLRTTGTPYREGEVVEGIYEPDLGEVMGQVGSTIQATTEVANQLRDLVASLNRDNKLRDAVSNFAATSAELKHLIVDNRARLDATLNNLEEATGTAKSLTTGRESELKQTLDNFSQAADHMATLTVRLDSLRVSIQSMTSRVNEGQGTLGMLLRDEKLYNELNSSVVSLKSLLEDVKRNPKKYFKFSVF